MLSIKIHESYRKVVAICDSDLIGKRFEEGKMQLEVRENFFKGKDLDTDEVVELVKDLAMEDATFNIVGKEAIGAAIMAGLIGKKDFREIQGVPFTLVLL